MSVPLSFYQYYSSLFLPTKLSGLAFWVRADKGITLNGSNVSAWADQSGTGDANKNLAQATSANQPAFIVSDSTFNNQAVVSGSTVSGQVLQSNAWTTALNNPFTVIIVGQDLSGTGSDYFFDNAPTAAERASLFDNTGGNLTIYQGTSLMAGVGTRANPSFIVGKFNGASSSIGVNQRTPQATGDAGSFYSGLQGVSLFNYAGGSTTPLGGKIAEVCVFSRVLSATEINQLANYVSARYAITIGA